MTQLTPAQLRDRYAFDWQVIAAMNGKIFNAAAYRSSADLDARRNAIATPADAGQAVKYLVAFRVPTIVGRDQPLQPETTIGFDLGVGGYPFSEPATWVVGPRVPYSPHFRQGAPVCLGELWREGKGDMLLGQLVVFVAKLLNWDEIARGGGYQGWNGDAIAYHKQKYNSRPLDPNLRYPALPAWLTHEGADDLLTGAADDFFAGAATVTAGDNLFAGAAAAGDGLFFTPNGGS